VSAFVGVSTRKIFPDDLTWVAAPVSVAFAIFFMDMTHSVHPPAGERAHPHLHTRTYTTHTHTHTHMTHSVHPPTIQRDAAHSTMLHLPCSHPTEFTNKTLNLEWCSQLVSNDIQV
jgi:hypothetical protein